MKRIIFLIGFISLIFSCTTLISNNDVEEIKSIILQTNKDLIYKDDVIDYWQPADMTRTTKTGDCEDFVILIADEIKFKSDLNCGMAIVNRKKDMSQHAVLYYNGLFLECTDPNTTFINPDDFDLENPVKTINYCALRYIIKYGYK